MRWDEPAPNEREAEERTWNVVRAAWEERVPLARPGVVRRRRPVFAVAAALVVVAAALSPPGMAVLGSIKDAVQKNDNLVSLPASGRILVNAPAGAWVVQQNGSKRLLSGFADASWSPHGLYLAAARGNTLVALEPNGRVHWKLAKTHPVGAPQWSFEGYRIAYLDGHALRVVNGDGTGDRLLAPNALGAGLPAFAWRPGTHELAYKNEQNELVLLDVDRSQVLWRRATTGVERLSWSEDGKRLLVATRPALMLEARGRTIARLPAGMPAAFVPHSESLGLVVNANGRSRFCFSAGRAISVAASSSPAPVCSLRSPGLPIGGGCSSTGRRPTSGCSSACPRLRACARSRPSARRSAPGPNRASPSRAGAVRDRVLRCDAFPAKGGTYK